MLVEVGGLLVGWVMERVWIWKLCRVGKEMRMCVLERCFRCLVRERNRRWCWCVGLMVF